MDGFCWLFANVDMWLRLTGLLDGASECIWDRLEYSERATDEMAFASSLYDAHSALQEYRKYYK